MQSQARYTWSGARVSLSSRLSKTLRSPTELPTLKDGFASNLSRDLAELRTYGLGEYQDLGTGGLYRPTDCSHVFYSGLWMIAR